MVREAGPGDAPAIARVHVDSWRETYGGIVPSGYLSSMSYGDYEGLWRRVLDGPGRYGIVYVAEGGPEGIAGFTSGGPRRGGGYPDYEGELYTLYVLAEHQGKGLGSSLLRAVADGLSGNGLRSMLAWVLYENPSRGFYEVLGGEVVGEQEIEIGGSRLREVAYGWKDVGELASPRG
ncbi:MAG: GNAT family N-acetyltransferase [Rubrobacter sp.]|nr:GNAT family N-acetyltransferase [Rubrobacter sp.]